MNRNYVRSVSLRRPLPADSYLNTLLAVRALSGEEGLAFPGPVTFLVGENGTGKSTLLEAIAVACGFNAEGGSRNFRVSTRDTHSELGEYLTAVRGDYPKDGFFLRAESFYDAASYLDSLGRGALDSYGGVSLHGQSHGESFLALVQNRFGGCGLYLLDEPEAALSPTPQLALMGEIHRLIGRRSQFIIATHSPILMAFPGACIYELSGEGIQKVDYRETEHYCLTKTFLNDPERMLRNLFSKE
ncbi:MAG: AAA family ATPase [Clostridiales bacterium]|nr:AAA family ATPase [Clostridiales bacterium]